MPDPGGRQETDRCCARGPCTPPERAIPRRHFLAASSLAAGAAWLPGLQIIAGPFERKNRYLEAIPADKKLDPAWVESLYRRGEKDTYTDPDALERIGMPVGGLFAGTVYLGGDGRLWLWDIFNRDQEGISPRPLQGTLPNGGSPLVANMVRGGLNYLEPAPVTSPFRQGFALRVEGKTRPLDREGFSKITFDGRYPIAGVSYRDDDCPLSVELEAYSPFCPLNVDDSSLPVTVLSYTLSNRAGRSVEATISGHLQNPVCHETRQHVSGRLRNRVRREPGFVSVECTAEPYRATEDLPVRPEIVYDDFERDSYRGWTVEGDAFGDGPVLIEEIPAYQGDVGGQGKRVVNSHASAPGGDVRAKDDRVGRLISDEFEIKRRYIRFRVGGGSHKGKTCLNLVVDGKIVASATGKNDNRMQLAGFNVSQFEGKQARFQIVDEVRGGWGNIGVDEIVFTDRPPAQENLQEQRDFGSMSLALLDGTASDVVARASRSEQAENAEADLGDEIIGDIARTVTLEPGQELTVTWLVAWHFPNLRVRSMPDTVVGNFYSARFESSRAALRYVSENFERLASTTRKWVETWYDSTLPYWLLDRTMANTSTLATTTCYRFRDGRFWAWEGIGCCPGTCTHVWHYAQAVARLFPEIERDQRRRVDFGLAFHEDGGIGHRAYLGRSLGPAVDGHCGRILGVYREHQMSVDDRFLRVLWPRVRKAVEWLFTLDGNLDGVLEGAQQNTLDAAWYGKISWLSSLYLAALRAAGAMADEMGDESFAARCSRIADRGSRAILETFNGEYFTQIEDPAHADAIGTGSGCHIDQVFGQTWSHWVGLGTLFDREKQLGALRALWRYNFVPDIGPFREKFPRGRWYAVAGDAGLVMCTWPRGGENSNYSKHWQYGYFNECMSGFEWQAAAHMIWEGLDQKDLLESGLAVSRAIHDRYSAGLRNPYNEVECSDHYARAMASYGVFQAVCGFECHGPKGFLGFAPRLHPEKFRAAFTAAGGWGTYEQEITNGELEARITLRWGRFQLRRLSVSLPEPGQRAESVTAPGLSEFRQEGQRVLLTLGPGATLKEGDVFEARVRIAGISRPSKK